MADAKACLPKPSIEVPYSKLVILGAPARHAQLQDNLASFDLALSPDYVNILDDASHIDLGFPYQLYAKDLSRAIRYGSLRDQILAQMLLHNAPSPGYPWRYPAFGCLSKE